MKQKFLQSTSFKLLICFLFLITAIIIHSCKKDSTNQTQANVSNPAVSQAKQWYESTYPATTALNSKQTTQSVTPASNTLFDYTQHLKPDWQHAATYNRLGAAVIELPLDASSDKVGSAFRDMTTGKVVYKQQYSRSSFLLLNYGFGYRAYIMTIIADSSYLKGNLNKLNDNTYRKHDPDFTGIVMYFTPKGDFVSSFGFLNGKLMPASSQNTTSSTQVIQSLNTSTLKPEEESNCLAWFLDTYVDGELISSVYLYTTCSQPSTGGGGGGGGEDGGGSGSSPAPAPCIPPQSTGTDAVTGHLIINAPIGSEPPPPTDGGNPAPVNYCPTATITATDTTVNPCAQKAAISALAANAIIKNQDSLILKETISSGSEYGTNQNLTSIPGDTYINTPVTSGTAGVWTPTFTWDSTNGFTTGFSHGHPAGDAPSPNDVASIVYPIGYTILKNAGVAAVSYYKDNAEVTTVTSNGTYVVTVNNWSAILNTIQSSYSTDAEQTSFKASYLSIGNTYLNKNLNATVGDAGVYALIQLFGNSINIYYAPPGSTTYTALTVVTGSQQLTNLPCP